MTILKYVSIFIYISFYNILVISSNCVNSETNQNVEYTHTEPDYVHAESPAWDSDTNTLYWVDVLRQNVYSYNYCTKKFKVKHICYGEVNIVIPIKDSDRVLVGVRSELFLLDWNIEGDKALRLITVFDEGMPDNILNEGKADALGRFWGGTKGSQHGNNVELDEGAFYSLETSTFVPEIKLKPVTISNGLIWSLNNSILYYIDSQTRKIDGFTFDLKRGLISGRRTIFEIGTDFADDVIFDGMTIDKDGFLWVALFHGGAVIRVNPDKGCMVAKYVLPVSQITSMTWAGPDLTTLVVTTSRRNLNDTALKKEPLAGALFILNGLNTGGVPDNKYVFPNADNY